MELSTALAADLRLLTTSTNLDAQQLLELINSVLDHARSAVNSFVGLRLVVVSDHSPIQLSVFDPETGPDNIASSIHIPFSTTGTTEPGSTEPGSFVTFYATVAGAFVDLAADLSYALQLPDPQLNRPPTEPTGSDSQARSDDGRHYTGENNSGMVEAPSATRIVVDRNLRPDTTGPVLTGVTDAATINRAIGALIEGGHHPDDIHDELDRRASGAGLTKAGYAAWFIETLFDPNTSE